MKKLILLSIQICLCHLAYSQIIAGTVSDKQTGEKVPFAAVYISGTYIGTTSDINGKFALDISKNESMPVSVSCMGYYSHTVHNYSTDDSLHILLEPKAFEVDEVVVSAKSLKRKRKACLRLFKKEFLGISVTASRCEILNEEDIFFNYGSDRDTLKAYASKPIRIKNTALGYNITYYLDLFEYVRASNSFIFQGNIIFEENEIMENITKRKEIEEARKIAYEGSRMHFMRSLWNNKLTENGFSITDPQSKSIVYEQIVAQETGSIEDKENQIAKYISYPLPLYIMHRVYGSKMILVSQRVFFDQRGYHGLGIIWEGYMLEKRIGDALPYEYGL